ncbi:triacylglycerol lipase [Nocardioides caeni]|uniref:Triacylglycerol lipase n=1 Tax=Nocardioides caeni TaxID=574700 RepID=A0A4S8N7F2_9ACTN|nr:triacylglycerol lipase [Nocardioides caeni]
MPVTWNATAWLPGLLGRTLVPGWHPPGSNDPDCQLTPARPRPVVLVNFTIGSGWEWGAGSPFLANNGFCVRNFTYGNVTPLPNFPLQALGDIEKSARELAAYVDRVRAEFGVAKVDLVGWSQGGGMTPHYYINFLGGADEVHTFIGIAPGNHGSDVNGVVRPTTLGPVWQLLLRPFLPALAQQITGSELERRIYGDGDTRPGPRYVTIVTQHDEIATPYTSQFLDGPGVTNILLQDGCPADQSEHLSIGVSRRTWGFVLNELAPAEAAPVPCIPVLPLWGSN